MKMYKVGLKPFVSILLLSCTLISPVFSEQITVGVLTNSGAQRTFYTTFAEQFEQRHPSIQVKIEFKPDAEYKTALTQWFKDGRGPHVLNWQGGERLFQYVRSGHIAPLNDVWREGDFDSVFSPGSIGAVSMDSTPYAIPISYYQWGFYYRQSLFDKLNLQAPATWQEFLEVCRVLKSNDIVPITVGAKFKWPTAAWFDYFNLRINGLDFHQRLLKGEIPFTDQRVTRVLDTWKELLDNGYFVTQYNRWKWDQAMPFLYHKMAGMTLMGNFFASTMPATIKSDFGYFPFPVIDRSVDHYEEAPLDVFMLPSYAKNNQAAKTFIKALAEVAFQQGFNEKMGMISPNMNTRPVDDYFIEQGRQTLNSAQGVSQFFDRDTNAEMSGAATEIFTRFMDNKDVRLTQAELERARQDFLL